MEYLLSKSSLIEKKVKKKILSSICLYNISVNGSYMIEEKEETIDIFLDKMSPLIEEKETYYDIKNDIKDFIYYVRVYKKDFGDQILYSYSLISKKENKKEFFGFHIYDENSNCVYDFFSKFSLFFSEEKSQSELWDYERYSIKENELYEQESIEDETFILELIGKEKYEEIINFLLEQNNLRIKNIYKKIY